MTKTQIEDPLALASRFVVHHSNGSRILSVCKGAPDMWIQVDAIPLGLDDTTELVVHGSLMNDDVFRIRMHERGDIWTLLLEVCEDYRALDRITFARDRLIAAKSAALKFDRKAWAEDSGAWLEKSRAQPSIGLTPGQVSELEAVRRAAIARRDPRHAATDDLLATLRFLTREGSDWWGWTFTQEFVLAMAVLEGALEDQGR